MSIIDTLIYDRTQADVDRVKTLAKKGYANMTTAEKAEWNAGMKGAFNYADANRWGNAVVYLHNLLTSYGITPISYTAPKTNWVATDIPTNATFGNIICADLGYMRNVLPNALKRLVNTVPELNAKLRLDYKIANDMETVMKQMGYIECIIKADNQTFTYNLSNENGDVINIIGNPNNFANVEIQGCVKINYRDYGDHLLRVDASKSNVYGLDFKCNNLSTIILGNSSCITEFICPALITLYIPKDVVISSSSLAQCYNLTALSIESGSNYTATNGLIWKPSINATITTYGKNITIPTDSRLTTIKEQSMMYFPDETLNIPNNITTIEQNAFYGTYTGLKYVNIGAGLSSISTRAFYNATAITTFSVDANNTTYTTNDYSLYNIALTNLIAGAGRTTVIPNGVTSISEFAFYYRKMENTTITIPTSITSIGQYAFYQTNNINNENMQINYLGTMAQWNAITKGSQAVRGGSQGTIRKIHCTDGDITVN